MGKSLNTRVAQLEKEVAELRQQLLELSLRVPVIISVPATVPVTVPNPSPNIPYYPPTYPIITCGSALSKSSGVNETVATKGMMETQADSGLITS